MRFAFPLPITTSAALQCGEAWAVGSSSGKSSRNGGRKVGDGRWVLRCGRERENGRGCRRERVKVEGSGGAVFFVYLLAYAFSLHFFIALVFCECLITNFIGLVCFSYYSTLILLYFLIFWL